MPRATYCIPQVTSFGYTEKEAGEMERPVKIGKFPFQANGKALALGDSEGMVKVVVDAETDEIIGGAPGWAGGYGDAAGDSHNRPAGGQRQ